MSSIAGPSTPSFSAFSAHPRQPPAISTKLRHVQDAPDNTIASSAGTPVSATPVLTTAPTTAPPTPILRSSSQTTDVREASQDPAGSVAATPVQNGTTEGEMGPPEVKARTPKASVAADLDAVKARTIALSREHKRGADEEAVMVETAARIASRLAEDHRAALFPDVDEPFVDEVDVVKRLLPYHVFQLPQEDLEGLPQSGASHPSRKGKRKATEEDLLRAEIADTKFAIECWKRRRSLEERFKKARVESGKRSSPSDQGYVLEQAVLEVERAENVALNAELRSARAELDKLEREKRASATPSSSSAASASSRPTPTLRTANASNYYSASTTPTTATFMPPYRPPYSSYSQYPTTQYTYNPYYSSYTPTTSTAYNTTPQTPATPTTNSAYTPPATASTTTPTSAASAQVQQAQAAGVSNTAIPVQLPVSSLPALAALGIIPIAATSLPPAGQPQPPAVIKSTNGSMLSLEINLSLLQAAQMGGLVFILNALTSKGVNVDGTSGAQAGSAAVPAASSGAPQGSSASGVTTANLPSSGGSPAALAASNTAVPSTSTSSAASTPGPTTGS